MMLNGASWMEAAGARVGAAPCECLHGRQLEKVGSNRFKSDGV
jgi:hypothetical protein